MKRFEPTALVGLLIGISAIGGSIFLNGIKPSFLWQPTALLIVLGGTLGAVTVRCGLGGLITVFRQTALLFRRENTEEEDEMVARLAWLARAARKEGQRVFEHYASSTNDRLVARGLTLACDLSEPTVVRTSLDSILEQEDQIGRRHASLLESAGGYAPTFGILGAVLGLIHVLRALENPSELGAGIATAFVATIYGLGFANLFFFPLAARLRERHQARMQRRELLAEALVAVCAHESPTSIRQRFSAQG
jgi:chemotaxis protein MotA